MGAPLKYGARFVGDEGIPVTGSRVRCAGDGGGALESGLCEGRGGRRWLGGMEARRGTGVGGAATACRGVMALHGGALEHLEARGHGGWGKKGCGILRGGGGGGRWPELGGGGWCEGCGGAG